MLVCLLYTFSTAKEIVVKGECPCRTCPCSASVDGSQQYVRETLVLCMQPGRIVERQTAGTQCSAGLAQRVSNVVPMEVESGSCFESDVCLVWGWGKAAQVGRKGKQEWHGMPVVCGVMAQAELCVC